MRAGDDEIVASAQEKFLQRFRQREVVKFAVEHRLDLRVAALDGVADDDHIRVRRDVFGPVALADRDAFFREETFHRLIDILVRAGDGETPVAQSRRDRPHRRAADSEKMDVLEVLNHSDGA